MDLGLAGRACAVTGASRGIGRETARELCAEGARVLLVARSPDDLAAAAEECARAGGEAAALELDVTDPEAGDRIVAEAGQRFGGLDVLVNNAGSAIWRDLDEVPDSDWQAAWELNVMAPLRAMRAAIPAMAERGWGRVVNVSEHRRQAAVGEHGRVLGRQGRRAFAVAAVRRSPRQRRRPRQRDLPRPGEVGAVDGRGRPARPVQALAGHESREDALDAAGSKRPIGRLAEVEEVAAAIVFLCSERASYVAGAAWSVDGGTVQVII